MPNIYYRKSKNRLFSRAATLMIILMPLALGRPAYAESPPNQDFNLPTETGFINEQWGPQTSVSSNHVYLIQDIHAHPPAQRSLIEILEYLYRQHGVRLLATEGAEGKFNLKPLSDFPDSKALETASNQLLDTGTLSGQEYFALANASSLELSGIDDFSLYQNHIQSLRAGETGKGLALDWLASIETEIDISAQKTYPAAYQNIRDRRKHFASQGMLSEYLVAIQSAAPEVLSQEKYPHTLLYLNIESSRVDPKKVADQRKAMLRRLWPQLNTAEKRAVQASTQSPEKSLAQIDSLLKSRSESSADPDAYPDLHRHWERQQWQNKLRPARLLQELRKLERDVAEALVESPQGRRLLQQERILETARNLSLSRIERSEMEILEVFDPRTARELLAILPTVPDESKIQSVLAHWENRKIAYQIALRRDQALAKKIIHIASENRQQPIAAVVGGFHTAGITDLLKQAGYSYTVVTPNSSGTPNPNHYLNRLYEDATSATALIGIPERASVIPPLVLSPWGQNSVSARRAFLAALLAASQDTENAAINLRNWVFENLNYLMNSGAQIEMRFDRLMILRLQNRAWHIPADDDTPVQQFDHGTAIDFVPARDIREPLSPLADTSTPLSEGAALRDTVVIRVVSPQGHLLLGQKDNASRFAGQWELIRGGIHPGESPETAAARELLEETGLVASTIEAGPVVEDPNSAARYHLFTIRTDTSETGNLTEHVFAAWVPQEQLSRRMLPLTESTQLLLESEQPTQNDLAAPALAMIRSAQFPGKKALMPLIEDLHRQRRLFFGENMEGWSQLVWMDHLYNPPEYRIILNRSLRPAFMQMNELSKSEADMLALFLASKWIHHAVLIATNDNAKLPAHFEPSREQRQLTIAIEHAFLKSLPQWQALIREPLQAPLALQLFGPLLNPNRDSVVESPWLEAYLTVNGIYPPASKSKMMRFSTDWLNQQPRSLEQVESQARRLSVIDWQNINSLEVLEPQVIEGFESGQLGGLMHIDFNHIRLLNNLVGEPIIDAMIARTLEVIEAGVAALDNRAVPYRLSDEVLIATPKNMWRGRLRRLSNYLQKRIERIQFGAVSIGDRQFSNKERSIILATGAIISPVGERTILGIPLPHRKGHHDRTVSTVIEGINLQLRRIESREISPQAIWGDAEKLYYPVDISLSMAAAFGDNYPHLLTLARARNSLAKETYEQQGWSLIALEGAENIPAVTHMVSAEPGSPLLPDAVEPVKQFMHLHENGGGTPQWTGAANAVYFSEPQPFRAYVEHRLAQLSPEQASRAVLSVIRIGGYADPQTIDPYLETLHPNADERLLTRGYKIINSTWGDLAGRQVLALTRYLALRHLETLNILLGQYSYEFVIERGPPGVFTLALIPIDDDGRTPVSWINPENLEIYLQSYAQEIQAAFNRLSRIQSTKILVIWDLLAQDAKVKTKFKQLSKLRRLFEEGKTRLIQDANIQRYNPDFEEGWEMMRTYKAEDALERLEELRAAWGTSNEEGNALAQKLEAMAQEARAAIEATGIAPPQRLDWTDPLILQLEDELNVSGLEQFTVVDAIPSGHGSIHIWQHQETGLRLMEKPVTQDNLAIIQSVIQSRPEGMIFTWIHPEREDVYYELDGSGLGYMAVGDYGRKSGLHQSIRSRARGFLKWLNQRGLFQGHPHRFNILTNDAGEIAFIDSKRIRPTEVDFADDDQLRQLSGRSEAKKILRNELAGADLRAMPWSGLNLGDSRMAWANAQGVIWDGVDVTGADLTGIDFGGAHLDRARMDMTNLYFADLSQSSMKNASLRFGFMERVNLREANLAGADLRYAFMVRADLRDSDLTGTDLTGTDLTEANLSGANLSHADLREAIIEDADITGTTFYRTKVSEDFAQTLLTAKGLTLRFDSAESVWLLDSATRKQPDQIDLPLPTPQIEIIDRRQWNAVTTNTTSN